MRSGDEIPRPHSAEGLRGGITMARAQGGAVLLSHRVGQQTVQGGDDSGDPAEQATAGGPVLATAVQR